MRLWSLHPQYLDPQGLVALWREGLLAKKVLEGNTKGYKNHPQLNRFKAQKDPVARINLYLHLVCDESLKRGYKFDRSKLAKRPSFRILMTVNSEQMIFEWEHLMKKQKLRSPKDFARNAKVKKPLPHGMFKTKRGRIEDWEIV